MCYHQIRLLLFVQVLSSLLGCTSGPFEKASLDNEVRRLCAIDGGIKVYETVRLPADMFNQWGQVSIYMPTQGENALGANYQVKSDTTYYQKGNPEMSRSHIRVFRKSDRKLLGESISYGRGGGDMPGPWHDSSYHCPAFEYGYIQLFNKIFVINGEENQ